MHIKGKVYISEPVSHVLLDSLKVGATYNQRQGPSALSINEVQGRDCSYNLNGTVTE